MSCRDANAARLSARMDGELDGDGAREVDGHVASCPECARVVADHEALRARVADLPRAIAPGPHVWKNIAERIDARGAARVGDAPRTTKRGELGRRRALWGAVAAAAIAVLAVRALRRDAPVTSNEGASPVAAASAITAAASIAAASAIAPGAAVAAPASVAEASLPQEAPYRAAIDAMDPSFRASVQTLPEESARRLVSSLHEVDMSIERTRAALAEHPGDADLEDDLGDAYRLKIQVMNDVLDLATRS